MEITSLDTDTTYVINFWATWCSPCVREISYFEELYQTTQGKKLKVILLSLDFPATLIYNRDKRISLEQELTREELNTYVNQILN